MKTNLPKRCVDPVMKYCECCEYGNVIYSESDIESGDLTFFDTTCILGFDEGRIEDEPTEEDFKEFEKEMRRIRGLEN